MKNKKSFFIIWNPGFNVPPKVKFATLAEAKEIAQKMARQYKGNFYVMRAVAGYTQSAPAIEDLL